MSSIYYNLFVVLSMFPFENAKNKIPASFQLIDHNINNFSSEEHLPGLLVFFLIFVLLFTFFFL